MTIFKPLCVWRYAMATLRLLDFSWLCQGVKLDIKKRYSLCQTHSVVQLVEIISKLLNYWLLPPTFRTTVQSPCKTAPSLKIGTRRKFRNGQTLHFNGFSTYIPQLQMERTTLSMATRSGVPAVVDYLLNHGIDINWRMTKGNTALMIAVNQRKIGIMPDILLAHPNIDINVSKRRWGDGAHDSC